LSTGREEKGKLTFFLKMMIIYRIPERKGRVVPQRKQSLTPEQKHISENMQMNEVSAKNIFPKEKFVDASSFKLVQKGPDFEVPKNLENIKIAKSRITPTKGKEHISDNDAKTVTKELRQARVLTSMGASVYILPKIKDAQGRYVPGPDALVNGTLYEFKTITGAFKRLETRFRESRDQGENVYIRFMKDSITRNDVMDKMYRIINSSEYTGGYKGTLIFSIRQGGQEKVYYIKINDLKE
jgi:hypothetical protein